MWRRSGVFRNVLARGGHSSFNVWAPTSKPISITMHKLAINDEDEYTLIDDDYDQYEIPRIFWKERAR